MTLPSHLPADVYAAYLREQRARPGLPLETYLAERAPDLLPREPRPLAAGSALSAPSGSRGQLVAERDVGERGAPGRAETRVTTGRHRRVVVRRKDGLRFDSLTEERWFEEHRKRYDHVDLQPRLTLAGGIRYTADFLAWPKAPTSAGPELVDVKGSEKLARATDIQRIRKLCEIHPLGPLHVVWWCRKEKAWKEA